MAAQGELRLVTIPDPNTGLGVAVRLMMAHPAFSMQKFGEWARVLEGQARRGHQVFILDETQRAVGCFGYAVVSESIGEAWLNGRYSPSHEECLAGDCLIFNAWISEDLRTLRFMWNAFRVLARNKKAAFYKRYYEDGSVRPVRLEINEAVAGHIARAQAKYKAITLPDSAAAASIGNIGG